MSITWFKSKIKPGCYVGTDTCYMYRGKCVKYLIQFEAPRWWLHIIPNHLDETPRSYESLDAAKKRARRVHRRLKDEETVQRIAPRN